MAIRSRHSAQPIMLIGGLRHGEILTVRPDQLHGILLAPKVAEPTFTPYDDGNVATRISYETYLEQWFVTPDGWRQLAYVESEWSKRLDSISGTTMIAAILGPWRELHRLLATGELT